jgi:chromosome segregation ATPase
MVLENLMYFALGLLIAALAALIVLPAVWRRAVRLTKKRIEAATPITMSEFRADKDQLRAEFALQTRRLEMTVETLRKRLADQLRDVNRSKLEMDGLDGERSKHQQITKEFEEREAAQRQRVLALDKEIADLSQKLRKRERELADKVAQIEQAREAGGHKPQRVFMLDGARLSGAYDTDVATLLARLEDARTEASEARQRAEALATRPTDAKAAATGMTAELDHDEVDDLQRAEAHMADAEERVTSLLAETAGSAENSPAGAHLAERLSYESELAETQAKVAAVERDVIADWQTDRIDKDALRNRLGEIATGVSRLVHALDGTERSQGQPSDETLYERVQKFVGAADAIEPTPPGRVRPPTGLVSDRLTALGELRDGN